MAFLTDQKEDAAEQALSQILKNANAQKKTGLTAIIAY